MKEEIPSRRLVLRGAVAVGCGLCLPIILSACDSKPGANSSSAALPSSPAPAPSAAAAVPESAKKVPQASVQYQAQPKGELKCSTCTNFIAGSNSCKLVDGHVSAEGWCVLWAKRV